jgi:hypothetical protein
MSSLDNGASAIVFRSNLLAAEFALYSPQREQEVNLVVGERLSFDFREDGLEMGSDLLTSIVANSWSGHLLLQISLATHQSLRSNNVTQARSTASQPCDLPEIIRVHG